MEALKAIVPTVIVLCLGIWLWYRPYYRVGTGASFARKRSDPENWYVAAIRPDSPIARAGIQVGDKVLAVNGHQLGGLSLRQARKFEPRYLGELMRYTIVRGSGMPRTIKCEAAYVLWPISEVESAGGYIDSTRVTTGMTVSRTRNVKYPSSRLADHTIDASL